MDVRSVAMLVGATVTIAACGVSAAACGGGKIAGTGSGSSSGNSSVSSGGVSSGGTTSSSGGFSSSSSSGGFSSSSSSGGDSDGGFDTDSGTSSGGGPDCGSTPSLHQNPAGDIYCGYETDGGHLECISDDAGNGGFCCLGGSLGGGIYAPQICAGNSAGCMIASEGTGAIPIQCNQISDCPGNGAPGSTACCLIGATVPAMPAGCDYLKSSHGTAIQCEGASGDGGVAAATSCLSGEIQVCSSDADCPSGTTCQPGKWKIYQIGFCQ